MGKGGRFACIFLPMVLTIASLCFQILIGLGGTNSKDSALSNIYFVKINTTSLANNPAFTNLPAVAGSGVQTTSDGKIEIRNEYTISLWNYCSGNGTAVTKSFISAGSETASEIDFCTPKAVHFWFDPETVWGLNTTLNSSVGLDVGTDKNILFDGAFNDTLKTYKYIATHWISTLYIIAIFCTALEILVGIGGLFSRLGSLFTSIISLVTNTFLIASASLITATYIPFTAAANTALKSQYGLEFEVGSSAFIFLWLSVACAIVSGILWGFSTCCVSGKSREPVFKRGAPFGGERAPHSYERVHEPTGYAGAAGVPYNAPYGQPAYEQQSGTIPLQNVGSSGAYEPFRHGQV
ncbi:MAG: hypothetical protein MMC33_009007 [Icmadophila ericetorum]|nr:hypothetical protein [Icmadophila ericetorum]